MVQGDLAQSRSAPDIISDAASSLGPLTLLVNNASVFEADELGTLNVDLWERQLAINLRAPVFLTREFARQLPVDGQGAVVNIIDQRVWRPTPHFFSYTLSKAALLTATQTMAQALAPRVRVNAAAGTVLPRGHQTIEDFAKRSAAVPLRSGGEPAEIAEAVLFLANARSVTGQMLAVDGGQHISWQSFEPKQAPDLRGIPGELRRLGNVELVAGIE